MQFSSDSEMQKVSREAQEFFEKVLFDEEPVFVSDEATVWDISTSTADELLSRCKQYYGKVLTVAELKQSLWKLLRQLNQGRSIV